MLDAGIVEQQAPVRQLVLRRPLAVTGKGGSAIIALPAESTIFSYLLDYQGDPEIGCSYVAVDLCEKGLFESLLPARTFITEEGARAALESGSIHSTNESLGLVIRRGCQPELRMPGELARHKILDMLGDLFILGSIVQARFIGIKSGHKLNAQIVRELAARYP
jgi:UDP-3-O-acyl-N-acetylglucosamine deacetylase